MPSATKKNEPVASEQAERIAASSAKTVKVLVLLVTADDSLWPQIGSHLSNHFILKQVDGIDEALTATAAGQPAIVLWDARDHANAASLLSRLQLHSPCFAIVALDDQRNASAWTTAVQLRQVVAHVAPPFAAESLSSVLDSAREEVNARAALLGHETSAAQAVPAAARKIPRIAAFVIVGALIAGVVAIVALRHSPTMPKQAAPATPQPLPQGSNAPAAGNDEKVDLLIEKAQQAMLERHFIDPADGSALTLYRSALALDTDNGEARQGLQRLAEILFARVKTALDDRKFDVALQALESARSINPNDPRCTALDERIASVRAEVGPLQIVAAINAQNFDRAAQLIEDAARMKSLSSAKLAQLRDELRRGREEIDLASFTKLIDMRLQQERLIEPRSDSAAFYLSQARQAGASAAALQPQYQELKKRLLQAMRTAIEQHDFTNADRLVAELHNYGVPAVTITSLQHDLGAARAQASASTPQQPQLLELAQARLAQGSVTEPDNDSALFYVTQLREADPKNSSLPRISSAVQAQILERARAALAAAQPAKAETLLQQAGGLGPSSDFDALNDRLLQIKLAAAAAPEVLEASLTRIKSIFPNYPTEALRKNIEGWVELAFVVAADGKVTKIKLLASNPPGLFDAAATEAMSRVRYKPFMQSGKPIAVSTKVRLAFRLAK